MAGNGVRAGATRSRAASGAPAAVSMPISVDGANAIRRLGKSRSGQPFGLRSNAIRTYKPRTPEGQLAKLGRVVMRRIIKPLLEMRRKANPLLGQSEALQRKMARQQARAFADRGRDGAKGSIARISIRAGGSLNRAAREVIQRRAQRAADAASRGSKPAERARVIYGNQLAFTGSGKPKAGKNNFRPGPHNTNYTRGTRKRRRRKP